MMKKKHIYIYLLGMLLFSVGCTGKFREFNTDQSGITDDDLLIDDNGFGIRLGLSSKASILTTISVKARTGLSS